MTRKTKKGNLDGDEGALSTEAGDQTMRADDSNQFSDLKPSDDAEADTAWLEMLDDEVWAARGEMRRIRRSVDRLRPFEGRIRVDDPAGLKQLTLTRACELRQRFTGNPRLARSPVVTKLVEELYDLADEVASMSVTVSPVEEAPSGDPAGQFKLALPAFSGRPDEMAAWKAALLEQFAIAGVTDQRKMIALLADGMLLPARFRMLATTAGSWPTLWARLAKAIPFRQVRAAVCDHILTLREITDPDDSSQVVDFCAGLSTFNQQLLDRGRTNDTQAWLIVEMILSGMGPMRKIFFEWEDMKALDEETTDTLRIEVFLQRRSSALSTHLMIEARKDGRKALPPPRSVRGPRGQRWLEEEEQEPRGRRRRPRRGRRRRRLRRRRRRRTGRIRRR